MRRSRRFVENSATVSEEKENQRPGVQFREPRTSYPKAARTGAATQGDTIGTTTRYLFLYRSPTDAPRRTPSPAEMEQAMAEWKAWKANVQDEIVDMGGALDPAGAVCRAAGGT